MDSNSNDGGMQFSHQQNIDANGSAPFQNAHQSIGQALGNHLAPPGYPRGGPDQYRHPSTSPPTLNQPHAGPSGHQGIAFAVNNPQQSSPALKRKQMDPHALNASAQAINAKRRKDGPDDDVFDDPGGQGAKHWTDDEKTKLFNWLMGQHSDEHWAALRATKNSCLRDCAEKVFDRKKSYQALKGCYERNFNLFKQIYALENALGHPGALRANAESERLREYERRITSARKSGCDVGNITARTVEHWFNRGWYQLFFQRWNGDPATTRPIQTRSSGGGNHAAQGDDQDDDDGAPLDFSNSEPSIIVNGINGMPHDRQQQQQQAPPPQQQQQQQHQQVTFINPQNLSRDPSQMPPTPQAAPVSMVSTPSMQPQHTPPNPITTNHSQAVQPHHPHLQQQQHQQQQQQQQHQPQQQQTHQPQQHLPGPPLLTGPDPATGSPLLPFPFNAQTANAYMQYLQSQTQMNKMKMEYMRRREEREEKEHRGRVDSALLQLEKDKLELDEKKLALNMKTRSEKAVELLARPEIDQTVKTAATLYLRKLFEE